MDWQEENKERGRKEGSKGEGENGKRKAERETENRSVKCET